jgi:hypothetical protein
MNFGAGRVCFQLAPQVADVDPQHVKFVAVLLAPYFDR